MAKIKKGDKVKILSGKDKGKEEKVLTVFTAEGTVLVENINKVKKHMKPTQANKGGIVDRFLPISVSRAMVVCPSCHKATKVGFKTMKDGKKVRVCKKCKENIDK